MRKLVLLGAALLLVGLSMFSLPTPGRTGAQTIKRYMLFNGSNAADSTPRASIWIPIQGASKVYLRTWTAGATADTDFCDTVSTWVTLFSDSVSFMARDSLGTIVTARSGIPTTSSHGEPYPMCADSVQLSGRAADSTAKMVIVLNPVEGVAKPLRGSASGSGRWSIIVPSPVPQSGANYAGLATTSANLLGANEILLPGYMRVRLTPTTRLTTAGFSSTAGLRTRGFNKLKIEALVVYPNK